MIHSRQLLPCPEECPSRMYAFMVECWHEVPTRRPSFSEIHARLRHWEGMSNGYQSTNHSTCNASQYSGYYVGGNGSQHSSTGPSNNTGSTNLNGSLNGGYSQPFGHIISHPPPPPPPTLPPPVGMVQVPVLSNSFLLPAKNLEVFFQGSLTEGKGSVLLTSLY